MYDAERFGILNIGTPKQADIMVVTGAVNYKNVNVLKNIYNQIPDPKAVVAVGACASTGGIFHGCYNVIGGVDQVIPVDIYVPGCCPRPEAIIDGIMAALPILEEKKKKNIKGKEVKFEGNEVPTSGETLGTPG
jgi:NADH:ubiquinone oxidoreductase 20 kD subunit and related Fe-S oxidoreductases